MFFFKKKPVELIAYTDNHVLAEHFPIARAIHDLPDYYKTMPVSLKKQDASSIDNSLNYYSTIRRCYGINQFNMCGFTLPLWADYSILTYEDGVSCAGVTDRNRAEVQDPLQANGVLDDYRMVKLISPWVLHCKEDIKFILTQNYYAHHSDKWLIPPGILNFKIQSVAHTFLLIKRQKEQQELLFSAGTPLTRLIPMTDKDISLRIEVIDSVDKKRIAPSEFFFSDAMNKMSKHVKKQNAKCPFHNH